MTGFSITPVGPFPEETDDGFPQFIQFQSDGTDLGGPDADTLNFSPGLTATRGVGENANVVTIGVEAAPPTSFIQWQQDGVDVGDDTINIVNVASPLLATFTSGAGPREIGLAVDLPDPVQLPLWEQNGASLGRPTKIVVGDGITVSFLSGESDSLMFSVQPLTLTDVPGDHTLQASDLNNGLSTSGTTGTQNIVVSADAQLGGGDLNGKSVLIYVEGAAAVDVLPVSGVNVHVRAGLTAVAAGQYATLTLIHTRHANDWVLCGDLHT